MAFNITNEKYTGRDKGDRMNNMTKDIVDTLKILEVHQSFELPFYKNYNTHSYLQTRFHTIANHLLDEEAHRLKVFTTKASENGIKVFRIK